MKLAARSGRTGFTLIELLVVILILAILMGLTAAGTFQVIEGQRGANTQSSMQTVLKTLRQHWDYVVSAAKRETPSPAAYALAGGDGPRAQVIWIKLRLMEAFPISYAEISTPPCYQPYGGSQRIPPGQRRYMKSDQGTLGAAVSISVA